MHHTRENISLWLNQSEPDYFMFFLKAWIPFNAWYVEEYPHLDKKDQDIINELQDDTESKPKRIIQNFLENESEYESKKFRSHLAELHFELERTAIYHRKNRISFKCINLTMNPLTYLAETDSEVNVYKVERRSDYCQAYVQHKGGKVLLDFKKPSFDPDGLIRDVNYIKLDSLIQNKLFTLYAKIDPKNPISILHESNDTNFIKLESKNNCKIISDTDTVAKACIKILYSLRNMLFHGEIAPKSPNRSIYENGFYMMNLILKKLTDE